MKLGTIYGYVLISNKHIQEDELKEMREFCNFIAFPAFEPDEYDLWDSKNERKELAIIFQKRLERYKSYGFKIAVMNPFFSYILEKDMKSWSEALNWMASDAKEAMKLIDVFYIFDEPDINPSVTVEMLEDAIGLFKKHFSQIPTSICFAKVTPEALLFEAPRNLDIPAIDPYLFSQYGSDEQGFLNFWKDNLKKKLEWINQQNKPWLLVGDSFRSVLPDVKAMPTPEQTRWYQYIVLTQHLCIGLVWFYYGGEKRDENLEGFRLNLFPEIEKVHRLIGTILLKTSLKTVFQ